MAHDAVISYSSRDKLQADAICNRLESRGIRCWIAPRDVGLGEYAESIVTVIEEAEMSKALELYVSSMHWLDAITPPLEQHLDKLADDLSALLAGRRETASPPPQTPAEKEPAPVVTAAPQTAAPKAAVGVSAELRNKLLIGAAALAVVFLALFWLMPGSEDADPGISLE